MNVSEEVRRARKALGLTQLQLAPLLHTSTRSIIRWEGGQAEPSGATLDLLRRLVAERARKRSR